MDPVTAVKIVTAVAPTALGQITKYLSGNHGSKVKMGDFVDCKIARFGDEACIVVNSKHGHVILLNSDTIERCQYVKEKKRMVGLEYKTYFYYNIYFKNGQKSYVRMSRKNRNAMLSHM